MFAHFGLAFASPPAQNALGSPLIVTRRLIKQKARGHRAISDGSTLNRCSVKSLKRQSASTLQPFNGLTSLSAPAEKARLPHLVSTSFQGTISLRSQRFFSPFPRGTCSLSVANEYLGLRRGRRRFIRSFTCIVLLRKSLGVLGFSVTGLSPSMAQLSRSFT